MKTFLFTNTLIYTLDRPPFSGWLLTENEKIADFGEGEPPSGITAHAEKVIDAAGKNLLPGMIDLHTHGRLGFCTSDCSEEEQLSIARNNAIHGVTAYLPTTMTDSKENIICAIQRMDKLVGKQGDFAKILGVHLEGPFFNTDRCGAQDPNSIRRATPEECKAFLDAGTIKRISMCPEYEENLKCAELFADKGISVSAGHTSARYEDLMKGLEHGFNSITHTYNGMAPFTHRDPGTIGGALAIPEYFCELICDNIHSHPVAHKVIWNAKGPRKITLVTDSIRPAGLPDGVYSMGESTSVTVTKGGTDIRIPNGALAGSALTMERALKNFTENVGKPLAETWPSSSYNAAVAIGMDGEIGSIEKGKLADLILLDDEYHVALTMINGNVVYTEG